MMPTTDDSEVMQMLTERSMLQDEVSDRGLVAAGLCMFPLGVVVDIQPSPLDPVVTIACL